jgi:hypothetical protein
MTQDHVFVLHMLIGSTHAGELDPHKDLVIPNILSSDFLLADLSGFGAFESRILNGHVCFGLSSPTGSSGGTVNRFLSKQRPAWMAPPFGQLIHFQAFLQAPKPLVVHFNAQIIRLIFI